MRSSRQRVIWYLYGTIARPTKDTLTLNNYADADFAGLYGSKPQESPDSECSRIGYTIFFNQGW